MAKKKAPKIKKDEQIGFHKGAVATLLKERQGIIQMLQVTETLMRAHINELKKLGIDITKKPE